MLNLDKYGKAIREYEGSGNLMLEGEVLTNCNFQMAQYVTGDILLHCNVTHDSEYVDLPREKTALGRRLDFDGEPSDGARLHFVGAMILGDTEHISAVDGYSRELWLSPQSATIEYAQAPKNPLARFSLVNLELQGRKLPLKVGAHSIQLIPLDDSDLTVEILKVTKGVALTSHALAICDDNMPISSLLDAVSNTCLLLSLIRGTRVNWLNYDILSLDGSIAETHCCDRITKRFGYV